MDLQQLADHLNQQNGDNNASGFTFQCAPLANTENVLQVIPNDRQELPIFVSVTEDQVLCITYLWGENEIKPGARPELMDAMLDMNLPMPLSAFSRVDGKYVLFGALALTSSLAEIEHELAVLSDNGLQAITELSDYLV